MRPPIVVAELAASIGGFRPERGTVENPHVSQTAWLDHARRGAIAPIAARFDVDAGREVRQTRAARPKIPPAGAGPRLRHNEEGRRS